MAKTKKQKQAIIADLKGQMQQQKSVVMVDFSGVDSKSFFKLRDNLKDSGCSLKVVKKTLLQKMLENLNQKEFSQKVGEIKGQMALAFGLTDEVAPAKMCYQFSQENKNLKILGAMLDSQFYPPVGVASLASLPAKPQMLGVLVGTMQAPISGFVNALQGNLRNLVYALEAIKETKSA